MSKAAFLINSKTSYWCLFPKHSSKLYAFVSTGLWCFNILGPTLFFFFLSTITAFPALGQTSATAVKEVVTGTVDIQQDTQKKKAYWIKEKAQLEARYRSATAHTESLERLRAQLGKKIKATQNEVQGLHRRLEESSRLEQGLQEIMEALFLKLEARINNDLPFLPEERTNRLSSIKETMAQEDLSSSDKLRRLFEALQIESEYGDTVEVYQQQIIVAGQPIFADIFRLGRLSIFWQTPDGKRVGEYDRVAKKWVALPAVQKKEIQKAVDMANKRRPIELIELPIGRLGQ